MNAMEYAVLVALIVVFGVAIAAISYRRRKR